MDLKKYYYLINLSDAELEFESSGKDEDPFIKKRPNQK